ncbi:MAG: hypothetical protein L6Q73_06845 [Aquabacterium sp.]|nr:hypothetical protein [Aquabacterium sp.]
MSDEFFALPPFKPAEALLQLKRSLRDLRTLTERGDGFELKGSPVIALALGDGAIDARLARRPMRGLPEWDRYALAGSPDIRKFTDEVRRRLARWTEEER